MIEIEYIQLWVHTLKGAVFQANKMHTFSAPVGKCHRADKLCGLKPSVHFICQILVCRRFCGSRLPPPLMNVTLNLQCQVGRLQRFVSCKQQAFM